MLLCLIMCWIGIQYGHTADTVWGRAIDIRREKNAWKIWVYVRLVRKIIHGETGVDDMFWSVNSLGSNLVDVHFNPPPAPDRVFIDCRPRCVFYTDSLAMRLLPSSFESILLASQICTKLTSMVVSFLLSRTLRFSYSTLLRTEGGKMSGKKRGCHFEIKSG